MQELVGRLTSLDPDAGESLKVVGYFDALVGGQVSAEVLTRSAAVLAGCPAGLAIADTGRVVRCSPDGHRLEPTGSSGWPSHDVGVEGVVWIERSGRAHVNDAMLLERFAIAVAITRSRTRGDSAHRRAVELVVDAGAADADRAAAAARLRLDPHEPVRAVATLVGAPLHPAHPTAIIATRFGLASVVILSGTRPWAAAGSRAGIGLAVEPAALPVSWSSALVALRLADPHSPVVDAADLGALLMLADAADATGRTHPDVAALEALRTDGQAVPTLDAFIEAGSIRAAAVLLGAHHSTVQARIVGLAERLGYDPRTATGRTRYVLARTLHRLQQAPELRPPG